MYFSTCAIEWPLQGTGARCAKPKRQDFVLSCLPLWEPYRNNYPRTTNEPATYCCCQVEDFISPRTERLEVSKSSGIFPTWQRRRGHPTNDQRITKIHELISRKHQARENGDQKQSRRRELLDLPHGIPSCSQRSQSYRSPRTMNFG